MKFNNNWMQLYVHSDDKKFKVIAVCKTIEEVNSICVDRHSGIITTDENGLHYVAEQKPS